MKSKNAYAAQDSYSAALGESPSAAESSCFRQLLIHRSATFGTTWNFSAIARLALAVFLKVWPL